MRKIIGTLSLILGVLCLVSSVRLTLYNQEEDNTAAIAVETLLPSVQESIDNSKSFEIPEMTTLEVDGNAYIGILTIPKLNLELPVFSEWSDTKLKKAPCRYYGACSTDNLVIAGHNYKAHFAKLSKLQEGDAVFFTDVQGKVHSYEVVLLETLSPTATKEMIESGFALSLYTCTYGGENRVTVRCKETV